MAIEQYRSAPPAPLRELDARAYLGTLRKRWASIAASVAICTLIGLGLSMSEQRKYSAEATLLMRQQNRKSPGTILGPGQPSDDRASADREIETQLEVLRSRSVLEEAARRAAIPLPDTGKSPISVDGGKDADIVSITATTTDPRQAAALANSVADVYVARSLERARSGAHAARVFLEGQRDGYRRALETADRRLRDYQESSGAVGLDAATENGIKALTDMESSLAATQTDAQASEARARMLRQSLAGTSDTIVSMKTLARNPSVQKLQDQLADLNFQRAALLRHWTPANRRIKDVDAQIDALKARQNSFVGEVLSERQVASNPVRHSLMASLVEAEGQRLAAIAKAKGLQTSIRDYRAGLNRLPAEQYRLAQLTRDVQTNEKAYLAIQDRYQQLKIDEQSAVPSAQILDRALVPTHPVTPNVKLAAIVAAILGLVLGAGIASLRETLRDSIESFEDVEGRLGLPVLGMVARLGHSNRLSLVDSSRTSGMSESYRAIRSSIGNFLQKGNVRTLMITSVNEGEGKTTTAANLAVTMARSGVKVVVVDTDLRRPGLHKMFGLSMEPGLTEALRGAPADAVVQTVGDADLHVITAGGPWDDAVELLDSPQFTRVMDELRGLYDLVLFDAPPLAGIADSRMLAGKMDATVLVVSSGAVELKTARRMLRALEHSSARVLGVILNRVSERHADAIYYFPNLPEDRPSANGGPARLSGAQNEGAIGHRNKEN
ncbi:MAG TPA: polysaccharide biosynthesis tyrosine autokinase [Armatimonadota bacterium]|jgi:capsular exopolysaccharide synthesis family protein